MKCPAYPEYKGINVIVQCESSPHYAGAWCAVKGCGLWIKWLNRAQYDDFREAEDARKGKGKMDHREGTYADCLYGMSEGELRAGSAVRSDGVKILHREIESCMSCPFMEIGGDTKTTIVACKNREAAPGTSMFNAREILKQPMGHALVDIDIPDWCPLPEKDSDRWALTHLSTKLSTIVDNFWLPPHILRG